MTARLDLDSAGPDELLGELHALNPRHSCPRWAVLGPSHSGKTQFLQQFILECSRDNHPRSPLPIYLDLKKLPLGREEQMYQAVFRELDLACRSFPFEVSSTGPPDGTGRFDHFINDLLCKAESRVALVVDHLDSAPQFFARSLVRRFRLMVDQEDLHPEFKNLCVLLAGRTSLFDLRQIGDSAFIASNLIFPRRNGNIWKQHLKTNEGGQSKIIEKLQQETGGEAYFVDLLFTELPSGRSVTVRAIDSAIDRLLANPLRHDVFHQIALEIASNLDLRTLVQDLLSSKGGQISRRDSSPDVDRLCLSGAVVLAKEQTLSCYRLRNGIVERFSRKLLQDSATGGTYFPPTAKLAAIRAASNESRDIYIAIKELLSAWTHCVFKVQPPASTFVHVRYPDSDLETWLDLGKRPALGPTETGKVPASALLAVKSSNEGTERHATFGFDEESVSYSIPYARSEAELELVLHFRGSPVTSLSESALAHWLRLVYDCWPWLAASALAEVSNHFALRIRRAHNHQAPAAEPETRIHWMGSGGVIVDGSRKCVHLPMEWASEKMEKTLDDINQRCLRMMGQGRTPDQFGDDLRGVANQLQEFFEHWPDLKNHMQERDRSFTFISDESGLKIPLELLPVDTSHLALESRIVRRLRGLAPGTDHAPFAERIHNLIEKGKPLKVLLAGADPRNSLESLGDELRNLKELIEAGCAAVNLQCSVNVLEPMSATQSALQKRLQDVNLGPFHIFHFCGHGTRQTNADDSSLILRGTRGEDDPLTCEKLRLMLQDRVLWMAYLSCCYGAATKGTTGIEQQYMGTIHAVLSAGIPTAVGFRWAVTDLGAYTLARNFYQHLFSAEGAFNPSRALWKARKSVAGDDDKRDAWASSLMVSQFG